MHHGGNSDHIGVSAKLSKFGLVPRQGGASPDLRISACTALIHSGRETPKSLANAFFHRGYAYKLTRQYDRAIEDYNQAIKLDPKHLDAVIQRGVAYRNKGDFNRALQDYDEVIRLDPNNIAALDARCYLRATVGQLDPALLDCNQSLALKRTYYALDSRGFIFLRKGRLDDALADYNEALQINPKVAASLYGRGLIKLKKGDPPGGNADIAAAKAIQTDIADELARYGVK